MAGAEIERLLLNVPTMSTTDARRLALAVAAGLASAEGMQGDIPSLRLGVQRGTDSIDMLANRIIAEALRQIRRIP
jgi:hypothetical protein